MNSWLVFSKNKNGFHLDIDVVLYFLKRHVYLYYKYLRCVSGAPHELILIYLLVSKLTEIVNEKKV